MVTIGAHSVKGATVSRAPSIPGSPGSTPGTLSDSGTELGRSPSKPGGSIHTIQTSQDWMVRTPNP